MSRLGILLLIVTALLASGCGGSSDEGQGSGRLTVLSNVAPVKEAFDADRGHARLVLILSPT